MSKRTYVTPAVLGACAGVVATVVVGFSMFGWVMPSKAEIMAKDRASAAVVSALTPLCVQKFQNAADSVTQLASLKAAQAWERHMLVESAGWAQFGKPKASLPAGLTRACADAILETK